MDLLPWPVYAINGLIAALIVLFIGGLAASRRQKVPGRLQNLMEVSLDGLRGLFLGALGPGGERHLPLVLALFFFIFISDVLGQVPFLRSATASTSTTVALGLIVFVYVQYVGIRSKGLGGYLRHFLGPLLLLAPLFILIEVIGELAKPFSLAMRLFGNIYGEDVINELATKAGSHFFIPVQLPVYFLQLFTDFIQAFIFALLTCAYISIMTSHHDDNGDELHPGPHKETRMERFEESMMSLGGGRVTSSN